MKLCCIACSVLYKAGVHPRIGKTNFDNVQFSTGKRYAIALLDLFPTKGPVVLQADSSDVAINGNISVLTL